MTAEKPTRRMAGGLNPEQIGLFLDASLCRMAAVGLLTPPRDGVNLVAKEYVAAQDPENPGVIRAIPG